MGKSKRSETPSPRARGEGGGEGAAPSPAAAGEGRSEGLSAGVRAVWWVLLTLLCLILFVAGLGSVPLMGMDESLYSDAARHMLSTGNYITPHSNGEPFFDKPPLVYWMMAGSMRLFGINSFAVRLPSAIGALLLVALTVWFAAKLWANRTGLLTGYILATSILAVALARMAILDMWFAVAISVSLGSFVLAHTGMVNRWWLTLTWAAAGVAVLVKGPAGLVVIGLVAILFVVLRWRERHLPHLGIHLLGCLIMVAIVAPWYLAVNKATGGNFLREFIFHQNIARAMGKDFYHNAPLYFYIPILLIAFFPWSVYLPLAWRSLVKLKPIDQQGEILLFAGIWVAAVFVLLSAVTSKLPGYIFPIFPPAAVLIAVLWSEANRQLLVKYTTAAVILAAIVAAALFAAQFALPDPIPGLSLALIPMGLSMLAGTIAARWMLARRGSVTGAFVALACGMAGFLLATVFIGAPIASRETDGAVPALAAVADEQRQTAGPVIIAYDLDPKLYSLPFYTGRRIEFVYPTKEERRATTSTPKAFLEALDASEGKEVIIVAQKDRLPVNGIRDAEQVAALGKYILLRRDLARERPSSTEP